MEKKIFSSNEGGAVTSAFLSKDGCVRLFQKWEFDYQNHHVYLSAKDLKEIVAELERSL